MTQVEGIREVFPSEVTSILTSGNESTVGASKSEWERLAPVGNLRSPAWCGKEYEEGGDEGRGRTGRARF